MAFLDRYQGEEQPGTWYTIGTDPETKKVVALRVRPLVPKKREAIRRKLGKPKVDRSTGIRTTIIPASKDHEVGIEFGVYCWTDCRNFTVRMGDADTAALYARELGRAEFPDPRITVGSEVLLDGRLTEAIKGDILRGDVRIGNFITEKGLMLAEAEMEEAEADEEALTENLGGTSGSASASPRSPSPGAGSASSSGAD